jgi:hypothetical protein
MSIKPRSSAHSGNNYYGLTNRKTLLTRKSLSVKLFRSQNKTFLRTRSKFWRTRRPFLDNQKTIQENQNIFKQNQESLPLILRNQEDTRTSAKIRK